MSEGYTVYMWILLLGACVRQAPSQIESVEVPVSQEADCPHLPGQFTLTAYPGMDAVGPDGERPIGMSKEYTFEEDTWRMDGYPPLTITGRWALLKQEEGRVQVRLTGVVVDGQPAADEDVWMTFSACGQVMEMAGMTYQRVHPTP